MISRKLVMNKQGWLIFIEMVAKSFKLHSDLIDVLCELEFRPSWKVLMKKIKIEDIIFLGGTIKSVNQNFGKIID